MNKFKLEIIGESVDGKVIKSHITTNINCEREMALSLLLKVMNADENLKRLFAEALLLAMSGEKYGESITDKEYDEHTKDAEL